MGAIGELARYAGGGLRGPLGGLNDESCLGVTEIRLRVDKPVIIQEAGQERFLAPDGSLVRDISLAYRPNRRDMAATLELLADHSLHAFLEEIKNGFITMPGGHRVGVSGQCVVEDGRVKTVKNITSLCFRAARQIKGCAGPLMDYIKSPGSEGGGIYHTMIISPPGCGKTTLLRDMVRLLSDGGYSVGVADERGEIAGSRDRGLNQSVDLGLRADVLEGCPKAVGMGMLLRSMSPDVIAVDEIGRQDELEVITDIVNAGVKIICTAHGAGVADLKARRVFGELLGSGAFKRFILLEHKPRPGQIQGIYDENFVNIYKTIEKGRDCIVD